MLENTVYKLTKMKKLTVAYFGGSITEGAGASDAALTSYRAKTTAWFCAEYPDAKITEVQAAIGGTGSDLGVYRLDRDVLSQDPDLVFFEFAVNDSQTLYARVLSDTESILRRILIKDPHTDIVMIFTTTATISDALIGGVEYHSRTAHSLLAHHYGNLLQIDVGEALRAEVLKGGGDFLAHTKDTVHPNDKGHALYAALIKKRLSEVMTVPRLVPHELPKPYGADIIESARLADAFDAEADNGWTKETRSLCGRYPHYLASDKAGARLSFTFTGERLGIYWMLASDGGDILYAIDGGAERSARAWDTYCVRFDRAHYCFLSEGLPKGEHTLTLRVAATKAEESEGHSIRIGAFLIS